MNELIIFEMDLTGGTCGFPAPIPGLKPADQIRNELIRRNRIINNLKSTFNIEIERIFLKNVSFLNNEIVKNFIFNQGIDAMPVFLLDGNKIVHHGSFPDLDIISQILSKEIPKKSE